MSDAYKHGFIDGIRAYAWHKDGRQEVGTTGRTLKEAIAEVENTWNYAPPSARPGGAGSKESKSNASAAFTLLYENFHAHMSSEEFEAMIIQLAASYAQSSEANQPVQKDKK